MPHTEITVYTNGFASFNSYHNTTNIFANDFLFKKDVDSDLLINILAPWWDDLDTGMAGSDVYYETTGFAPNRIFTIEWGKVNYAIVSDDTYTFQIKLYESSNIIEFVYGDSTNVDANDDSSASVGVKDDVGGSTHFMDGLDGTTTSPPPPNDTRKFIEFPPLDMIIQFKP
jgi:hypothetical protein